MAEILPPLCNITQGCYAITRRAARHESALLRTPVWQQCWFDSCKDDNMCKHLARHGKQSYPSIIATLRGTLKLQSNGPMYKNTQLIHWLLIGELLHLVQRGGDLAGPQPAQSPLHCTKCNSPPVNSQYTNFILCDEALYSLHCTLKG